MSFPYLIKDKDSIAVLMVVFDYSLSFILPTYALRARAGRVFALGAV